jgi:hypothetical protein
MNHIEYVIKEFPWYAQDQTLRDKDKCCITACSYMCLEYFKPNLVKDHDEYFDRCVEINKVYNYSILSRQWIVDIQTKALHSYGIPTECKLNFTFDQLDDELKNKNPVIIFFNHVGTIESPSGAHLGVIIGKTTDGDYILNDPYGSMHNHYAGETIDGKEVVYTKSEMTRVWNSKGDCGRARVFL